MNIDEREDGERVPAGAERLVLVERRADGAADQHSITSIITVITSQLIDENDQHDERRATVTIEMIVATARRASRR